MLKPHAKQVQGVPATQTLLAKCSVLHLHAAVRYVFLSAERRDDPHICKVNAISMRREGVIKKKKCGSVVPDLVTTEPPFFP